MRRWALIAALFLNAGCGAGSAAEGIRSDAPTATDAMGETEQQDCTAAPAYGEPLVVDLGSTSRVDLELALKEGVSVVRYTCDGLQILKRCSLRGDYGYAGVSLKEEVMRIENRDDVRANFPLGKVSFGGEIERGTTFDLALVLVGRHTTTVEAAGVPELTGADCEGATHFVRSATVGAFAMQQASDAKIGAAADVFGARASSGSSANRKNAIRDGDIDNCRRSTPDASTPPTQCRSAIRIELVPLRAEIAKARDEDAKSDPGAIANPCPEGYKLAEGKCTRDPNGPHLCAPNDEADCRAQCDEGHGGSCYHLARSTNDPATYGKACQGGSAKGCFYSRDYERGCNLGGAESCNELANTLEATDEARAFALTKRSCDLGNFIGCGRLYKKHFKGEGTPKDTAAGFAVLKRACEGGAAKRCAEYGLLKLDPAFGTPDPKSASEYLDVGCKKGYDDACALLGVELAKGVRLPKDDARARELQSKVCDASKKADQGICSALTKALTP